jgi:prepilin-type N-terminal cleavage/methylation domain-containing protein
MTLIELLVALVVSGILVGGVYRTFVSQQHTFTVQEQVVDMQQNVRLAINRMTRELRMTGFGRMDAAFFGKVAGKGGGKVHGTIENVITPGGGGNSVTVVGGYQTVTTLLADVPSGSNFIQVNNATGMDLVKRLYISINGVESHQIQNIAGNQITFKAGEILNEDHFAGEPIYLITAITYSHGIIGNPLRGIPGDPLLRDDNLGSGPQPVAENIDELQFRYVMNTGETLDVVPAARYDDIRMIQVNLVARTDRTDPELAKTGDGFRRRNLTSNIQLRNLAF